MLLLDGSTSETIGIPFTSSRKSLLKSKMLFQETFTIRAEKWGFFSFVEYDFVVTSEDTAIEKNMVLESDDTSELNDYFPLQIGNEWSFTFPYWTPSSGDTMVTVTYKITEKKQVNEKEYYAFNYQMPFFPDSWIIENIDTIFVRQNESGDIMLLVDDIEWPYFIFDEALVDSMVKLSIKDMDYWFLIESTNDTISTVVGDFYECYRILNYFPQIKGTEHFTWFAPGYGPVKIWYPELGVTYKLTKINIKSKN